MLSTADFSLSLAEANLWAYRAVYSHIYKFPIFSKRIYGYMRMQRWLGSVLSKHRKKGRCVLWGVTWKLAFPQQRFPTELQKHAKELPHLSWAASRVLTLSCLNLHSPGVQPENILATCLSAVSLVSQKKGKKSAPNKLNAAVSICLQTSLQKNWNTSCNVLIINTSV